MKVVILAAFPVHRLPGFEGESPSGHYATWLPQLAKNYQKMVDFEIHWIVMVKNLQKEKVVVHCGQTFHLLPRWKQSISILTRYNSERRRIRRLIKVLSPDVVHGWGTEDVYGFAQKDWSGARLLSMQGMLWHYWKISPGGFYAYCTSRFEKSIIKGTSRFSTESEWGKDRVLELNDKAHVDLVEYGVSDDFSPAQRSLSDCPEFVYVGSLDYRKGADTLLEAFSNERLKGIKLIVLGGGEYQERLSNLPNVEFLGRVPQSKVSEIYAQTWGLIHAARADTSPNSVKEARICGIPLLTTEAGGQAEYVEDGVDGLLFEAGDVEGLIEAVLKLSASSDLVAQYGNKGKESYSDLLAARLTAEKFVKLYQELAQESL